MPLPNNIKRLRHERRWSQEELARRAKLSANTVRNIERGRRPPSSRSVYFIVEAFGFAWPDEMEKVFPQYREEGVTDE